MIVTRIMGGVVLYVAALFVTLMIKYRGIPGRGDAWAWRDEAPLLYWGGMATVVLVGVLLGGRMLLQPSAWPSPFP